MNRFSTLCGWLAQRQTPCSQIRYIDFLHQSNKVQQTGPPPPPSPLWLCSPWRTLASLYTGRVLTLLFRHLLGLLWTTDQPVAKASTYTGQYNTERRGQTSIIEGDSTHDLSVQAVKAYTSGLAATGTGQTGPPTQLITVLPGMWEIYVTAESQFRRTLHFKYFLAKSNSPEDVRIDSNCSSVCKLVYSSEIRVRYLKQE
jgi:hypothetical protein